LSSATPNNHSQNSSRAEKIFRNFSFLTIGKILGDGFTFLLFIILSREFGQEGIGEYSFAMAVTGFFAALSEYGLYHFSIKEMSRHKGPLGDYYGNIFLIRLVLSLVVFLLLLGLLSVCAFKPDTKIIITLIGAYQIIYMILDGYCAVFVAAEKMRLAGILEFSLRMTIAAAGIIIYYLDGSLIQITISFPVVTLLLTFFAHRLVIREHGPLQFRLTRTIFLKVLGLSSTYATANILFILSARIDIILLGFYLGAAAAGIYNVAYRMIFILMIITHFASVSIFPLASRLFTQSKEDFTKFYHDTLNILILISIPASFGLWLVAPQIITIFFGTEFTQSISILRILAPLFFLTLMENILATFLMSCEKEKDRTTGYWITAWSNISGNIIMIPLYGCTGAAIATLLSKIMQTIYYFIKLYKFIGSPHIGSRVMISITVCVAMGLPHFFLPQSPPLVTLPLSLMMCILTLLLFKDVRENELNSLLNILKGI